MTFCDCSMSHPSTSSVQHIRKYQLHFDPVLQTITYLHTFYLPRIFRCLPHISRIPNSFIFSLSQLTPCVQIVSLTTHAIICTHELLHFFTIGLMQLSNTTLTHVLLYRPFLVNGLYYINKTSHHHIKKTTFAQIFQF